MRRTGFSCLGREADRWQNYFPHFNAFVRSRVHRPIGWYGRPAIRTQPISACALLTAMPLSAAERAHVRQATEKKFDAQAMPKLTGSDHKAGEVRVSARTNAYAPTQPRAAPPPGPILESYYFILTLFACSLCVRRSLHACG